MMDLKERTDRIRASSLFGETCPKCGEDRLMWKLDYKDNKVKLWSPWHFHDCTNNKADK